MANEDLARLVGHAFGDGSIHKKKQYFIYTNSNTKLHRNVTNLVQKQFGKVSQNVGTSISGTPRKQFSNKIGKELVKLGAPRGSKIFQETKVPSWILNGSKLVKSSFLAALFDDEGSFRKDASKQITFKAAKEISRRGQLKQYLEQLTKMLSELGVKTSEIKKDQIKKRRDDAEIVSLRFWITGRVNFLAFKEIIPLRHPDKLRNLNEMASAG